MKSITHNRPYTWMRKYFITQVSPSWKRDGVRITMKHITTFSVLSCTASAHRSFEPPKTHLPGGPKMGPFLYALTSSNINRFSKLFHCQNQERICNTDNTITNDPTTPQVCRYTTLWNVKCLEATIENKTTSVTTYFKEINNRKQRVYIVSVIV